MYDGRRATSWVSVFYFVSLIIMGMMIVMNLFLAILLSNFTNKEDVDTEQGSTSGEPVPAGPQDGPSAVAGTGANPTSPRITPCSPASGSPSTAASPVPVSPSGRPGLTKGITGPNVRDIKHAQDGSYGSNLGCGSGGKIVPTASTVSCVEEDKRGTREGRVGSHGRAGGGNGEPTGACALVAGVARRVGLGALLSWLRRMQSLRVPGDLDPGQAMWIMGPEYPLRRVCAAIVANPGFDRLILLLISISSIALAMDNPLRDPNSAMALALQRVEVVMTALFFVEMALKICAHGFVAMPGAYLRNSWNVLDFVVVVISLFQLFSDDSGKLKSLRSLRALRALRPLRFVVQG